MGSASYLAVDIGASSGRHIVGRRDGGELKTKEVYHFSNGVKNHEYTNASTTGLVSGGTYNSEIIARLGLPGGCSSPLPSPAPSSANIRVSRPYSAPPMTPARPWRASPWRGTRPTFRQAPGRCWA